MKRRSYILILLSLMLALSASSERSSLARGAPLAPGEVNEIQAVITPLMSYQGRLVEGGAPVSGVRSMTFSLYNASTLGTAIWSETQLVTVTDGLFQVALGSVNPFTPTVLNQMSQNLWLEINVAGNILPRQQLMGAPYALSLAPGANVIGDTTQTLGVGNLGSGAGTWSYSGSGHGVIASSSGSGLLGSALQAQSYSKDGIAAWTLANGTDASLVVSNDGTGPLIKGFGGNGGEHEFAILNDGTFQQELEASGLVKAAVYALCDDGGSGIVRSFNNVGGAMSIEYTSAGTCKFDFGFPVTDHYFAVTAPALITHMAMTFAVCAMDLTAYGDSVLVCVRQDHNGTPFDGYFMIVVY